MAQGDRQREDPLFVASLGRAVRILEAFDRGTRSLGLAELAEQTGLNRSAVQRFLHTWEQLGYLSKDPATRRFSLTPRVMALGYNYLRGNRLVEAATPYLLEARTRTGNSVYLGALYDIEVIYLVRLPQRFLLFESTLPGRRIPAFCGARAILSRLPAARVDDILARSAHVPITPHTVVDPARNRALIERTRELGYCVSVQEFLVGEIAVSAPVVGSRGEPLAAVYISAKYAEWDEERVARELAPIALETAGAIGAQF
jgi:DNA-binding IclR family transcriptional regulator